MGHPFRREPSMSEKDRILVRHSPECPRDTSHSLSLNLVDGWIMVSTQSGTHFANRQTPALLTLAPFERLNQGNIVATGTHVRGERIRHVGMIADLEPSILLMEVQHQSPSVRICVSNASRSSLGKALPLLSARRMIPAQALALKKYRRGTPPVSSVDDKEHTLAPLGHTEELSVQHSPRRPPHQARVRPRTQGATGRPVRVQPTELRARSPIRSIPDQFLRKLGDTRA